MFNNVTTATYILSVPNIIFVTFVYSTNNKAVFIVV